MPLHGPRRHHDSHEHAGGCCGGSNGATKQATVEAGESGCCGGGGKSSGAGCCKTRPEALKPMSVDQIAGLPTVALISRFRRGIEWIDRRVFTLDERAIDQAFLPDAGVGRWPVRVLLGHLADGEVAAAHRMRRVIGEENPVVALWDENAFIDAGIYANGPKPYADDPEADHARVMNALGGPLAVIHTLRQWIGQWLLTLPEEAFERTLMHPEQGPVTLRRYLAYSTWHIEHHAGFLSRKLDRLVGEGTRDEHAGQARHGGGCGCGH